MRRPNSQLERSWQKAVAPWNMPPIAGNLMLAVFQPDTSPLKTVASRNMKSMVLTLAVFQPETPLPAKAVAPSNM